MDGETVRPYVTPCVHEAFVFKESLVPKDDFGYPQNTKPPGGGICGLIGILVKTNTPNYTKQLQFHEAELAQAEQRGFPPGQVEYHAGKVAVLRGLV